eukprot:scaffold15637_cov109-Isochrysis_galbana.AAC.1
MRSLMRRRRRRHWAMRTTPTCPTPTPISTAVRIEIVITQALGAVRVASICLTTTLSRAATTLGLSPRPLRRLGEAATLVGKPRTLSRMQLLAPPLRAVADPSPSSQPLLEALEQERAQLHDLQGY